MKMNEAVFLFFIAIGMIHLSSEDENQQSRICNLPKEVGLCKGSIPRYFYNKNCGKCESFTYGGCIGKSNRFVTREQCEEFCQQGNICNLPAITGHCKAALRQYFHNATSGICELFIYGGCGGNSNRFETKEECEENCIN